MSKTVSAQDQKIIDHFCQYSFIRKNVSTIIAESDIATIRRLYLDIIDQMVRDKNTSGVTALVDYINQTLRPAHYHYLLYIGIDQEGADFFTKLPIYSLDHLGAMSKANCRLLFDRIINLFDDTLSEMDHTKKDTNDKDVNNREFITRAQEILSSLMANEGSKLKIDFIKQIESRRSLLGESLYGNIMSSYVTAARINEFEDKNNQQRSGTRRRHEYASL